MPTHEQAVYIASLKFGRRKLTSASALALVNKHLNDGKHKDFGAAYAGDAGVIQAVTNLNAGLLSFFAAINLVSIAAVASGLKFSLEAPDDLSFPKHVWLGRIPFPLGAGLTDAQVTAAGVARHTYAQNCGFLRRRYAQMWAAYSILNDIANVPDEPNPGGVVVGTKHTPENQS